MIGNILVIDDDDKIRMLLTRILRNEGLDVTTASDCKTALKRLTQTVPDVIIIDVRLPDGNGISFSKDIKDKHPITEIIMLTAYGNVTDSVMAIKGGAFDYIVKGDDNNKIIPLVFHAIEKVTLNKKIQLLEDKIQTKSCFESVLGKSKSVLAAVDLGKKVSITDATVLLYGETGTGKEVFAKAIHECSSRSRNNFVAVNCAAISKELLENEFFGHKAGSFTGATKDTKGIFEEANNGTIFLDEVGEMPLELQSKLLRVLENGEFLKVGESKSTKVNVRIIAATNRDLQNQILEGNFRQDLYYRLSVFQITLPPLRERLIDIEELANHFLKIYAAKAEKRGLWMTPNYLEVLKHHYWVGNIRELRNVIERSVILANDKVIDIDTLSSDFMHGNHKHINGEKGTTFDLSIAEKSHIEKVINYTNGNKTEAARLLNIAITTLYRKLSEYRIVS